MWNYADSLDAIPTTPLRMYLSGTESSVEVGSLSKKHPARSTSRTYTYDPLDTRPGEFELKQGGEPGSYNIMSYSALSERRVSARFPKMCVTAKSVVRLPRNR